MEKNDTEIDAGRVLANYYRIKKLKEDDNKFFTIALNLSGMRDGLEAMATDLISNHGYLHALKLSKTKRLKK